MILDILDNSVSEEETIHEIASMIIDGKNDDELSDMGYSDDLIESAHVYALSAYY